MFIRVSSYLIEPERPLHIKQRASSKVICCYPQHHATSFLRFTFISQDLCVWPTCLHQSAGAWHCSFPPDPAGPGICSDTHACSWRRLLLFYSAFSPRLSTIALKKNAFSSSLLAFEASAVLNLSSSVFTCSWANPPCHHNELITSRTIRNFGCFSR